MLLAGELQAIKNVISYARIYGFGSLIAHLRRAWALDLMKHNPSLTYQEATMATDVDPYAEHIEIDLDL